MSTRITKRAGFDSRLPMRLNKRIASRVAPYYPFGAIAYYDFPDLLERVNRQVSVLNIGGTLTTDGIDIASGDDVTASTYKELGAFNETAANSTEPTRLGNYNGSGWNLGIKFSVNLRTFLAGTVAGKYDGQVGPDMIGAILTSRTNGAQVTLTIDHADNTSFYYATVNGESDAVLLAGFAYPNEFDIAWAYSAYAPSNEAGLRLLRTDAGDIDVWPAAVQWPTISKIGFPKLTLDTAIANQVLFHSDTAKLYHDGTDLVAAIGATTSTLTIAPSAITSAYFEYDGVNVVVHANGTAGAGTASSAPSFNGTANIGSDEAIANPAQGTYNKLLVE